MALIANWPAVAEQARQHQAQEMREGAAKGLRHDQDLDRGQHDPQPDAGRRQDGEDHGHVARDLRLGVVLAVGRHAPAPRSGTAARRAPSRSPGSRAGRGHRPGRNGRFRRSRRSAPRGRGWPAGSVDRARWPRRSARHSRQIAAPAPGPPFSGAASRSPRPPRQINSEPSRLDMPATSATFAEPVAQAPPAVSTIASRFLVTISRR